MGNHHHVAGLHLSAQNTFASGILRIEHPGRPFKMPKAFVHACRFHHATVLGYVSKQHGQSAVSCIGMFQRTDTSLGTVRVQCGPLRILRPHLRAELAARRTAIDAFSLGIGCRPHDVVFLDILAQRGTVHTDGVRGKQAAFGQFTHNSHHASGTVAFLHRVTLRVGSQLTQTRHLPAQAVNVGHAKINLGLMGHCQQVEHRIG